MKKRSLGRFSWPFGRRSEPKGRSTRAKRQRLLHCEPLEERTLLAVSMAITFEFTDLLGYPLPGDQTDTPTVQVGQEFQLTAKIRDQSTDGDGDPNAGGVARAYFDVHYAANLASVPPGTVVIPGNPYTVVAEGTNDLTTAGTLTAVGGEVVDRDLLSSGLYAPDSTYDLFTIPLKATSAGQLTFTVTDTDAISAPIQLFIPGATEPYVANFAQDVTVQNNITLTITAGPAVAPFARQAATGTPANFLAKDFTQNFSGPLEGSQDLQSVKITALPTLGTLTFNSEPVVVNVTPIPVAQLNLLVYTPPTSVVGNVSDTFYWTGSVDGATYAAPAMVMIETWNATIYVGEGPTVTDISISEAVPSGSELTFSTQVFDNAVTDYDLGDAMDSVTILSLPEHGTLKLSGAAVEINDVIPAASLANLTYQSNAGYTGTDSFSWTASDGDQDHEAFPAATVSLSITTPLDNHAPTLTGSSKTVEEDADLVFSAAEFTGLFQDADEDLLAKVKITTLPEHGMLYLGTTAVTLDQEINVDQLPLTYRPSADYNGDDSFQWNGSDGFVYAAAPATVSLTVSAVNDAPTLGDITSPAAINEDAAEQTIELTGISAGGGETQELQITPASSNEALIDTFTITGSGATRSLKYTPKANQSGTATITVTVTDPGADGQFETAADNLSVSKQFTVTVNAVNDLPTLDAIADRAAIDEDAGEQTVSLTGISAGGGETQNLQVTATSSNEALIDTFTITGSGDTRTLKYTPKANQSGTATITVRVTDAGLDGTPGNSDDRFVEQTFTVVVNAVNDAPTLDAIANRAPINVNADEQTISLTGISAGGGESQALRVTASSSNPTLTGALTIDYVSANATGALKYTPATGQVGTATITVTVTDAGPDGEFDNADDKSFTRQFTVTVNTPPVVTSSIEAIADGATQFVFTATTFADHFSDVDGNSLASVRIVSLPTRGILYLGTTAVQANAVINVADLDELKYTLSSTATGLDSFTWKGNDGSADAATSAVMSFAYASDLPALANFAKTIATNATLTFTPADFTGHFTDPGVSSLLYTVKITALPAHGALQLNGTAVTAGQVINKADLAKLTYVSDASYTGNVTFQWNASNGKSYAAADATVTITCSADVPVVSNLSLNLATDTTLTFTQAQFTSHFTDLNPAHSLQKVKITALPSNGTLKVGGVAITEAGRELSLSELDTLTFTPTSGYTGAVTIQWTGSDSASPTNYPTTVATITINVAADVPVVSNSTKTMAAGSTLTFAAADFTSHFTDTNSAHGLEKVKITALPSSGTLKLGSETISAAGRELTLSELASLTYTPNSSYTGTVTIQWTGSDRTDGTNYATTAATISITVASEIPTVSGSTQVIASGATLPFDSSDFIGHFTDTNSAHSLQKVKITALPTHGTLLLDSTAVTANQEIAAVDLWKLTYVASASYTGPDTFTWSGSDGANYSAASANVAITVKADVPTLTAITKTAATATTLTFTIGDFASHFSDPDPAHSLQKVMIVSKPSKGTLKLLGTAIADNQVIDYADLANLTYVSNSGATGTDSFTWKATDGTLTGANYNYTSVSTVTINLVSDTPVAGAFTEKVAKNTVLTFSVPDFTGNFTDYNADHSLQLVKFTALPTKGTLKFNGVAVTTGQVFGVADLAKITYTPNTDYTGADTLSWSGSDGTTYSSSAAITVTTVADVPVVAGFSKNVAATTSSTNPVLLSFTKADFTSNFLDYDAADSLKKIKITQLPTHGTLKLDGVVVTVNQEISEADLSKLTYQTNVNFVGTDTLQWNGSDGDSYAATAATITLNSMANVPAVNDFTKTVLAGTATISFTVSDFADSFTNPAGDALKLVKITQLPIHGTLKLNGTAVTVGQEINAADLGGLTYVPSSPTTAYSDAFKWVGMGSPYSANDSTTTIEAEADTPTTSSFTKSILIGASYTFTAADFTSHFSDTDSAHSLQKIKITALPSSSIGTLTRTDDVAVAVGSEISLADLAKLKYTSTSTTAATGTIGWQAADDDGTYSAASTIAFNAVGDAPTVDTFSKSAAEDTLLNFAASDFTAHFTDLDSSHSLQKVKITALPSHGTLSRTDGVAVGLNTEINVADLSKLTYVGASNYNGTDSFSWTASDGSTYATTAATVNITVAAVNDLPTVSSSTKTTGLNTQLTFAGTDFSSNFSDIESETLQKVKITALPQHGKLKLSGTDVTLNQEISLASLGNLTYTPTTSYVGEDAFTWTASDATGYATTGATFTITVGGSGNGTSSISGSVYLDVNHNGARDSGELGLQGVGIQLQQQSTDQTWIVVNSTVADASGNYSFSNLAAGTYKVVEISQPYCYLDGVETAGSAGGTAGSDVITGIALDAGEAGTGYLFGEAGIAGKYLSLRLFLLNTPPVTQYLSSLNQAPTVDLNGSSSGTGSAATYTTGSDAVKIASSAKLSDGDGGCLTSMTVTITNLGDGDSEVLAATTAGTGISASYSGGVLRLTGAASLATYQTVLQSITYKNSDTTPTNGDRAVTVVVSDGVATSEAATATVTVNVSSSTTPTATVTTAPATISAASGSTSTTTVVVTYADADNGIDTTSFGTADITVSNGATVTSYSANGNVVTYTIKAPSSTWSASTQGTYTIKLAANQVKDLAGNYVTANDNLATFKVDTVVPTASVPTAPSAVLASNASQTTTTVSVTYADSGLGLDTSTFGIGDITVSNGATVTGYSASGNVVTYTITAPSATWGVSTQGTYTVALVASQVKDLAGNAVAANSSLTTFKVDTVAPTVTINQASGQSDPTTGNTINFTVVFSESVTGFTTSDVILSGTATGAQVDSVTGSGATYNVVVKNMTGPGTVIANIAAGAAQDAAGNASAASTSTDHTVNYNTSNLTVTINQKEGQADPTNGEIHFTVVFSQAVTNFATGDVVFTGSTATGTLVGEVTSIDGSNTHYDVKVTGITGSGTVVASIPAGVATDSAGNANSASTTSDATVTYDTTAPTVTINRAGTQSASTNGETIYYTVVFSEAVTGFDETDVTLVSSASDALQCDVTGSGTTYTVAVQGMSTSGSTITATIGAGKAKDLAGNDNTASTSEGTNNVVTFDTTAPTVTIAKADTQVDPTKNTPILFTVTFSESVTDFTASDVTFTGTATGTAVSSVGGSGAVYTISVTATGSGTVIPNIAADKVQDLAGNNNVASTGTATVTFDVTAPTVTVEVAEEQPDANKVHFTVTFIEPVHNFANDDVTLGGTAGTSLTYTVTPLGSDGTTYDVAVSGMTTSGTVTASIAANVAEDDAGNGNQASNMATADYTPGGVSLMAATAPPAGVVQDGDSVTVTGTAGADTIVFVATAGQYTLTVNGTTYTYSASEVGSFAIDGNGGDDTVHLTGDNSDQTAVLHPRSATFQGGNFTVDVTNAKSIKITAGSGDSEAHLYDSVGNDLLQAEGLLASLTGEDFAETAVGFQRVKAFGTNGGTNTASLAAVDFLLSQQGSWQ